MIILMIVLAASLQLGCRAQQPWPLWQAYSQHFVDGQGRVMDRSAQDRTTSEGQAYALFFALVANDRKRFEQVLNWTEANLAQGDLTLHLPSWEWGKSPSGEWKILDENPASDADLWMAYALLEAGRLWHDPRYAKLGQILAARIAQQEVVLIPGVGTTLSPGPHGFRPETDTWLLNPSYLPPALLLYLARTLPSGPWGAILDSLPAIVGGGSGNGYAMDWVSASPNGVHPVAAPAQPTAGPRQAQAAGSYDAIRVYLWLGMSDPETPQVHELLAELPALGTYMHTALTPPLEVDATGKIVRADAPPGFSAAIAPYLAALGMKAESAAQLDRLLATRDPNTNLYGRGAEYYDQNLALFATGFMEHRFHFDHDGKLKVKWK